MLHHFRRLAQAGLLSLLILGLVSTAFAQDGTPPPDGTPAPPPPACVPDPATACVKIVFYPATLKADLFLGTPGIPATADAPEVPEASQPTTQVQASTLYVTFANPAGWADPAGSLTVPPQSAAIRPMSSSRVIVCLPGFCWEKSAISFMM